MRRLKIVGLVSLCLLAATVSVAGYFFEDAKAPAERQAAHALDEGSVAAPHSLQSLAMSERAQDALVGARGIPGAGQDMDVAFGTDGRAYQREASLSVRVNDVFEALASVEKLAGDAKGYLETIDVSGTPQTHDGRIRLTVPSDKFTEVFGALRKLGDLLTERITAQMVTGNRAVAGGAVKDAAVELVRIDLALSDNPERLAKTEVKGLLAGAWQRSMDHFGKGGAVLLEAFGYVLPFLLSFVAILIVVGLFGLGARLYAKIAGQKIPYAVPVES